MAFICGSFRSQKEDSFDEICPLSSSSSPRKPSKRRQIFGSQSNKSSKNPYSDRGLDKFAALLAELDQKRQEIYTQKGSEDIAMVKFVYRNSNEVEPIVVKIRDRTSSSSSPESDHQKHVAFVKDTNEPLEEKKTKPLVNEPTEKIRFNQCKRKIWEWWKPWYYFPLIVILILVLLMFSGRSFAILCTSIGWYFVPIVNERLENSKQPNNKDDLKKSRRGR